MLIKILLGLAVIIVGIIIASRFQPHTYTVERTGTIAAPPRSNTARTTISGSFTNTKRYWNTRKSA